MRRAVAGAGAVADIAAAGVSPKTVFASAGSKGEILDRIVDRGVATSGHEDALGQMLRLRDAGTLLAALAHGTRTGNERHFLVHEAVHKALPVHENGEALWRRATGAYRDAVDAAARRLHTLTPPPSGAVQETADRLWFWFGPTSWRTLVVENGWSWEHAEDFLRGTAVATLCGPAAR
ncbi:TetR/AcrR family transcriptional regulator [Streptomyces sp. NBC_01310]|uniref:TetR/AcrR family transcriptional regulator n=1 Tax=Streptomyces sp. NBC_01310 TaxID=2903820 RepID=UPI0035B67915|nr:TetR/AcrR family transcriptional regulator [Streptomyces sp. NBC_01310]WSJ63693.1 TetR/AcrR family transcriptional regulator [Streptomyces sp. NBC_01310]